MSSATWRHDAELVGDVGEEGGGHVAVEVVDRLLLGEDPVELPERGLGVAGADRLAGARGAVLLHVRATDGSLRRSHRYTSLCSGIVGS